MLEVPPSLFSLCYMDLNADQAGTQLHTAVRDPTGSPYERCALSTFLLKSEVVQPLLDKYVTGLSVGILG